MLVNEIASIVKNKVSTSELTLDNYISTDNMLPNYSGIQPSTVLPAGKATAFCPEDILLSNIRPYFRKIWFSNMHGGCNADIICLRVNSKRCVPQYLYYQLLTDNFINNYVKSCKGAKMPRGDVNKLLEYDFYCPEYEEQLRITNILGTIDKQIELYKKKYEIIDEFSRLIYDLWFVQYDYLCNGKPYKSSDGQIVWNKELKAYIPLDWQVVSLSECIKSINTGLNPRKNFVLNNGSNKYITVKNLMANGMIDFENCDTVSDDAMRLIHRRSDIGKEDILFASIEPLGRAYLLLEDPIDWDINESVFSLRVEKELISPYFLYFYLRSNDIIKKMEQSSTGSVFKGIRISVINDMKIALPNKITLHLFDDIVGPLVHEQKKIEQSIKTLAHQKRVILPLLMNGQAHLN